MAVRRFRREIRRDRTGVWYDDLATDKNRRNVLSKLKLIARVLTDTGVPDRDESLPSPRSRRDARPDRDPSGDGSDVESAETSENGGAIGAVAWRATKRELVRRVMRADVDRDAMTRFVRELRARRYSPSYATSLACTLSSIARCPVSRRDVERLVDETTDSTPSIARDARRGYATNVASRKTDGRLTFRSDEFDRLLRLVVLEVLSLDDERRAGRESAAADRGEFSGDADRSTLPSSSPPIPRVDRPASPRRPVGADRSALWRFLFVFYMLSATGKRLSDVCDLTAEQFRVALERGACVIRVRKTRRLGRVEIPEIARRDGCDGGASVSGAFSDRREETIAVLRAFDDALRDGDLTIPIDSTRARRALDDALNARYEREFGRARPRGLSFHALRRAFAGTKFLQGYPVATIQESLDHPSREQTNEYVNRCLFEMSGDATIASIHGLERERLRRIDETGVLSTTSETRGER